MPYTSTRPRPLTSLAYVPVRQNEDHAWLDTAAIGLSPEQVREKAAATDSLIPTWAAANPVVRIARVTLTEEKPV